MKKPLSASYILLSLALLTGTLGNAQMPSKQASATIDRTDSVCAHGSLDGPTNSLAEILNRPEPSLEPAYILGPGDQLSISVLGLEEMRQVSIRVEPNGEIALPLVGRLSVSGLTTTQLEHSLQQALNKTINHPQVAIEVSSYQSKPVSVFGSVKNPGVYQLEAWKSLAQILSMAGGLLPEAGGVIKITRAYRPDGGPVPAGRPGAGTAYSVCEVNINSLMTGSAAVANLMILPNDVISVPPARLVYVIGQVKKSGAFPIRDDERITVLQALALAEGLGTAAAPQHARLLRYSGDDIESQEIPLNLAMILDGRNPNIRMEPKDILFVPDSLPKKAMIRAVEAAIQMATGVVVWKR